MKRLLLPLLAALAIPTAVNAESYWLVLHYGHSLEKIEMESLAQCEEQGYIASSKKHELIANPQEKNRAAEMGWKCFKGK